MDRQNRRHAGLRAAALVISVTLALRVATWAGQPTEQTEQTAPPTATAPAGAGRVISRLTPFDGLLWTEWSQGVSGGTASFERRTDQLVVHCEQPELPFADGMMKTILDPGISVPPKPTMKVSASYTFVVDDATLRLIDAHLTTNLPAVKVSNDLVFIAADSIDRGSDQSSRFALQVQLLAAAYQAHGPKTRQLMVRSRLIHFWDDSDLMYHGDVVEDRLAVRARGERWTPATWYHQPTVTINGEQVSVLADSMGFTVGPWVATVLEPPGDLGWLDESDGDTLVIADFIYWPTAGTATQTIVDPRQAGDIRRR